MKPFACLLLMLFVAACAATHDDNLQNDEVQAAEVTSTSDLDWDAFEAWRTHFATAGESWREIPWRATYREGLADAEEAQQPLLLWVMNGHPLGPT